MYRESNSRIGIRLAIALLFLLITAIPALAQSSTFTYQGKLQDQGAAANGTFDFQFKIFTGPTNDAQLPLATDTCPGPITVGRPGVSVTNGNFSVKLDFSNAALCFELFSGDPRYLEIAVRHNSNEAYVTLSPRQQITSTPYAIRANTAFKLGTDGSAMGALIMRGVGIDFPSTANNSTSDFDFNLSEAQEGDAVFLSVPNAAVIPLTNYSAWVSSAGHVTIRFTNQSGSAKDPQAGAFWILLMR
ncbi:MAG TPA: hypothetical protein VE863_19250 [Pyrinomonadaceae bacterium]|jgi:hypothetical protein|nr:hypothetical protein [Pyrinomonadaceae bacterium]